MSVDKLINKLKGKGVKIKHVNAKIIVEDFESFCKAINGEYRIEKEREICEINVPFQVEFTHNNRTSVLKCDLINLEDKLGLSEEEFEEIYFDKGISYISFIVDNVEGIVTSDYEKRGETLFSARTDRTLIDIFNIKPTGVEVMIRKGKYGKIIDIYM